MPKKFLIFAVTLLTASLGLLTVLAQEVPLPLPPESDESTITQEVVPPIDQTGNTLLKQYHIAYLIENNALTEDHVVAPAKVSKDIGAVVTNDWQSFLIANQNTPFQAVILHKSALSFVDYVWFNEAYKQGVIVSLIDIYYPEIPRITGIECADKPSDEFYKDNFFVTMYVAVRTVVPSDKEIFIQAIEDCKHLDVDQLQNIIMFARGAEKESLEGEYGYRYFTGSLMGAFSNIEELEKNLAINLGTPVAPTENAERK
jgi:hypothetical protein